MSNTYERLNKYIDGFGLNEGVQQKDDIIRGITFEDVIIAVQSNEKVIDKNSVMKVYNEMLKTNLEEAKSELNKNMNWIIKQAK